jgi:hypothetical protein
LTSGKETLPLPASAKPEFTGLTEDEVWLILRADPESEQVVTAEVNRLVAAYTTMYMDCVKRNGPVPPHVMYVRAEWPIERVAVAIVVEGFKDVACGGPATIH